MKKVKLGKIIKRKKLPNKIRTAIIGIFAILLIFSLYSIYSAYGKPLETQETDVLISYSQTGTYNYDVYLLDNLIYNKTVLKPGEGVLFKNIVDHINATFNYNFKIDSESTIFGTYKILALVQTDMWSKTYTLVPEKSFTKTGKNAAFTQSFPIDFLYFEDVVAEINSQIGVNSPNPSLVITSYIQVDTENDIGDVHETFSPSISVSLNKNVISMSEVLSSSDYGSKTEKHTVIHSDVATERTNWGIITIIFAIILAIILIFTKNIAEAFDKTEKMIKKIRKKYGEWIIDVKKPPKEAIDSNVITVETIEDLMKTSEELAKPVLYYKKNNTHNFCVIDNQLFYEFTIS